MTDRRNEANLLFSLYTLSTIGLLSAMAIYSSYLTWWWRDVDPARKSLEIAWKGYYVAYLIMTVAAAVVLAWSLVVFFDFLGRRGLDSPLIRFYLRTSLFAHVVLLVIPLLLMLTLKVTDPKVVLWVVWIIVNLILGTFALNSFEKYMTVAFVSGPRVNLKTYRV